MRGDRIRHFVHGRHAGEREIKNDAVLDLEAVALGFGDLGIWVQTSFVLRTRHFATPPTNFLRWKRSSFFFLMLDISAPGCYFFVRFSPSVLL